MKLDRQRYLDLQLFADDGLDDVDDDDPNDDADVSDEEEEDEEIGEEELEEEDDFSAIEKGNKQSREKAPAKTEQPEDEEDDAEEKEDEEVYYTEAQLKEFATRQVQERLARDPLRQAAYQIQQRTGKTMDQIMQELEEKEAQSQVQELMDEKNLDEDEAREYIRRERENQELRQKMDSFQKQQAYNTERQKYMSDPYVKKYLQEIDQFSQNGTVLDFATAKNYVIGQKVTEEGLAEDIKTGAHSKTLADMKKQSKHKVQKGSYSGGGDETAGIDPWQKKFAAQMDVPLEEVKKENKAERRRKKPR